MSTEKDASEAIHNIALALTAIASKYAPEELTEELTKERNRAQAERDANKGKPWGALK